MLTEKLSFTISPKRVASSRRVLPFNRGDREESRDCLTLVSYIYSLEGTGHVNDSIVQCVEMVTYSMQHHLIMPEYYFHQPAAMFSHSACC